MKYGLNIPAPRPPEKMDRVPVLMSDVYRRQLMHPINGYIANLIHHMKALPALVPAPAAEHKIAVQQGSLMPAPLAIQGQAVTQAAGAANSSLVPGMVASQASEVQAPATDSTGLPQAEPLTGHPTPNEDQAEEVSLSANDARSDKNDEGACAQPSAPLAD